MKFARVLAAVAAFLPAATLALPLCDSVEQRIAFYRGMDPWRKALEDKRYDDLDRHFNALIADTAAARMTDQELERWFDLFSKPNAGREPLHEDWIRAYPRSAAAYLASAYYYQARGSDARGREYASKTSESQFVAMGEQYRTAFHALSKAEPLMTRPTLVASQRMWMHAATGDRRGEVKQLYRDALKKYPETIQVRVIWLTLSHPKWGGSIAQLKDIPADASTLSKDNRRYIDYLVNEELGSTYRDMEEFARAAEYYKQAIPLCPGLEGAITAAMKMHQSRKDFEALIPVSTTHIERYPRNNWGWAMRGWAHLERKEYVEAARDYEKGAQYGSSYAQEGLAWLTETGYGGVRQDPGKAIELYETAAANGSTTAAAKAEKLRKGRGAAAK